MINAVSLIFVTLNVASVAICVPALAHLHWTGMTADNEVIDRAFPGSFVRRDAITAENVGAYEAALAAAKDESACSASSKPILVCWCSTSQECRPRRTCITTSDERRDSRSRVSRVGG